MPRPDWYFYFLFYLLRIFKWPDTVFLGTIGIPTILPHPADRDAVHRPAPSGASRGARSRVVAAILTIVSMGVLTWKGATAKEALASEVIDDVPQWVAVNELPPAAVPGAKLFAVSGCTACHTYLGDGGSSNLGAPDLTADRRAEHGHRVPDRRT